MLRRDTNRTHGMYRIRSNSQLRLLPRLRGNLRTLSHKVTDAAANANDYNKRMYGNPLQEPTLKCTVHTPDVRVLSAVSLIAIVRLLEARRLAISDVYLSR